MTLTGDAKREYQRKWIAKRRTEWFRGKNCIDCSATDYLELDHIDPKKKISHRIWSWSWQRINEETAKCVVRCFDCHLKKTKSNREYDNARTKLTPSLVKEIRDAKALGASQKSLALSYGVSEQHISRIILNKSW